MTADECRQYEADLHAYAGRLRRNDDERHVAAQHQADEFSRQVLRWQSEARMLEVEAKAAQSIRITLSKIAEVAKSVEQNYDILGDWTEKGFRTQEAMLHDLNDTQKDAEVEKIAKAADAAQIVVEKRPVYDAKGRIERIEYLEDGTEVAIKYVTYDAKGRIESTRLEVNPFVEPRAENRWK